MEKNLYKACIKNLGIKCNCLYFIFSNFIVLKLGNLIVFHSREPVKSNIAFFLSRVHKKSYLITLATQLAGTTPLLRYGLPVTTYHPCHYGMHFYVNIFPLLSNLSFLGIGAYIPFPPISLGCRHFSRLKCYGVITLNLLSNEQMGIY